MSMKRGLFIVFEGLDRVGKSSQIKLLQQKLEDLTGRKTVYQRFPDRDTASGIELNSLLNNNKNMNVKASHLLFSFNRWEKMNQLKEHLKQGTNILVDRYAFSGVAYSISNGCDLEYALFADKGLIRPDLVIQLDMNVEDIKNREGYGNEIYEKEDFQIKVQNAYKIFHNKKYWKIINANQTKEEVFNCIVLTINDLIKDFNSIDNQGFLVNEDLFLEDNI